MLAAQFERLCKADFTKWPMGRNKMSFSEMCRTFGVQLEDNQDLPVYRRIVHHKFVSVTEEIVNWLGIAGQTYQEKLNVLAAFCGLKEGSDEKRHKFTVSWREIERFISQSETESCKRLRSLFGFLALASFTYYEYEDYCKKHSRCDHPYNCRLREVDALDYSELKFPIHC